MGDDFKAINALQEFLLRGDSLEVKTEGLMKNVYDKSGIKGIQTLLIELELKRSKPDPFTLAARYAEVDKKEETLRWLEKTFEDPPSYFPGINNGPDWDNLRSEPRFQAIIKKMGLSEYQTAK